MSPDDVGTVLKALDIAAPQQSRESWTLRIPGGLRRRRQGSTAGQRAQATGSLPGQRLHVRGDRCHRRRPGHHDDCHRVGGRSGRAAGRSPGRPERVRQHQLPPRSAGHGRGAAGRYAVIDVGTNSVKFQVAERQPDGRWRAIVDRAEITRLGEGLEQAGEIIPRRWNAPSSPSMTWSTRRGGRERWRSRRSGQPACIARNSADVLAMIRRRTGVDVDVISGEDEPAGLPRRAIWPWRGQGTVVVFDTGGGGSQFTFGEGARVDERWSVDVGAVRFRSSSGWTRPFRRRSSSRQWTPSVPTCRAWTADPSPMRWSAWVAPSPTWRRSSGMASTTPMSCRAPFWT